MSHTQLIDAIIQKRKEKKPRRIGNALFKTIVEMAYEMKYANRYCEAERSNRFVGVLPHLVGFLRTALPFEVVEKNYNTVKIGDIVVELHFRKSKEFKRHRACSRIAKIVRINKKSLSLADCDQDGRLVEYNPDDDTHFDTKEERKNYNKLFSRCVTRIYVITGTKHLRYEGWNS